MSEREESRNCYLSVYRLDRVYGGPEEGGWYYTTYELVAAVPFRGLASIKDSLMDDLDLYAGGYDPQMIHDEEDGRHLTTAYVVKFDDPESVSKEEARLTAMYSDSKGRMRDFTIMHEVYLGEAGRLTGRRYC